MHFFSLCWLNYDSSLVLLISTLLPTGGLEQERPQPHQFTHCIYSIVSRPSIRRAHPGELGLINQLDPGLHSRASYSPQFPR